MHDIDIRRLDLNLLLTLHVLIEERQVSRAAVRLGLSQSAVSHALQRLRFHFDDPLLVRQGQQMIPTPRAQSLAGPLRDILRNIETLVGPAQFDPREASGTFRIATTDYGLAVVLPRVIAKLSELAPGLSISCSELSDDTPTQLKAGFLDLALSGQETVGEAVTETLFTERFVAVTRADHPLAEREMTVDDFTMWPHARIDLAHSRLYGIDRALERMGQQRRVAVRMPYFLAAAFFARSTDLIVPVPERIARIYAESLNLAVHEPPPELDLGRFDYLQVWHERRANDPLHRWFRDLVWEATAPLRAAAP